MSTSFNTKRRKDKTHKKAAPSATTDDDKTKKKGPPKPPLTKTTFQEKIARAHRARNVKSQKQMFMDVVLSKEFGT